jgi:putative 4-mercaptohistidine N1-methyltranferase
MTDFYESDRALAEYLLFHYGQPDEVLPHALGPAEALGFPVRCVTECLRPGALPANARALDLGCAVGRSSFELARWAPEVIGVDASKRFIEVADALRRDGRYAFEYVEEGDLRRPAWAEVPPAIDRTRVRFRVGDAQSPDPALGTFDVILLANLLDRLPDPGQCLRQLPALARPGAQLIVTSPYTWMEDYTAREKWLGGYLDGDTTVRTFDGLKRFLNPAFELVERRDLPLLIREHARKYQWSVAEATIWCRR